MVQMAREVERKYEFPDGVGLPALTDLPEVTIEGAEDVQQLEATYFDTTDLRLARRGVTIRRRSGGHDDGWHLKLPAGPDARDEFHTPAGPEVVTVPDDLADLVRVHSRGAELSPVARIHTTRTRRRLLDPYGSVLAELVADEVVAQTLDIPTRTSWAEVEMELGTGGPDLLDTVDARLRAAGVHQAAGTSKLTRLFGDRLPPAPEAGDRFPSTPTAGDAVMAYLRAQVRRLVAEDPRARRDEPDAAHRLRTATRRFRATLRTFRKVVDGDRARHLGGELRWLARALGEVRDTEVIRDRLERQLADTPVELVAGPVADRVAAHLSSARTEAHERLLTTMRSQRYDELLADLEAFVQDPPLTPLARRDAEQVLPKLVRRSWKRADRRMTTATQQPAGADRDEAVHTARKAAKRARYAAELAVPVYGKHARRFANRMEDLQDLLGEHTDGVMTRRSLREMGMQAYLDGENGFTFGLLYGTQGMPTGSIESTLRRAHKRAGKRRARRWLH